MWMASPVESLGATWRLHRWADGNDIYLDPAAAYREVQLAGRDRGEVLPVTEATLRRRLKEKSLLATTDRSRETIAVRRNIGGTSRDVLHFRRSTILRPGAE